jgi:predicted acetyltransferase
MKYELKELNMNMGKLEYDMYQDIPLKESGSTNLGYGLPYEVFERFLEQEMSKKYLSNFYYGTPTTIYIMYVDDYPVGLIGLRFDIDDNWKIWSGNFYYVIRKSERGKGYATKMLNLALDKFREKGFKEVISNSSAGNVGSQKVIENNGGILLREEEGSHYYKIIL